MQPLLRHEIQSARRARVLNDSLMQELERVARAEEDVVDKQKRLVRYVARACGFGDNVAEAASCSIRSTACEARQRRSGTRERERTVQSVLVLEERIVCLTPATERAAARCANPTFVRSSLPFS